MPHNGLDGGENAEDEKKQPGKLSERPVAW
jgi:hypothetical protein